ncbi:hypothetical protein D3C87_1515980 [compost metagenome]
MKLLFALLVFAAPVLAQANTIKCLVAADGVNIPERSYVEIDPAGPFMALYRNYSREDGPVYFVKSELISNTNLSSWKAERSSPNCAVSVGGPDAINVEFKCGEVSQLQSLEGSMRYNADAKFGHYSQKGINSNGREMKFEFDFFGCIN